MCHTLPTIEGTRVNLRWVERSDADALYEIFSDSEVTRYWSSPAMTRRVQATDLVADIHECFTSGELFEWGVVARETNRVIGTCTLSNIDRPNRRAEIGYALNRAFWGRGLMTEALELLLEYGFREMNLHRIEADVDPRNLASIRSLERFGFVREGRLRERWHVNGEICDTVFFGLLQREWFARRASEPKR